MDVVRSQDVDNALNASFFLTTQEDADMFSENKKLIHSVFEQTLVTDQGNYLVSVNDSSFDAQVTCKSLSKYWEEDTKASLDSSTLIACITEARIDKFKVSC